MHLGAAETSRLLTIMETAERLRVSRVTVYRHIRSGELPALRVGGQLRVDQTELGNWLYAKGETA
jgi:excisionase family DNA binding protein